MASTKAQQEELAKLFAKYHSKLSYLYTSYTKRIIKTIPIGEKAEDYWIDNPLFNFDLFPELRERLNQIFIEYFNDNMLCYKQGISDGVALAYSQDDVNLGRYTILQDKAIDTARKATQTAFYERRVQRQGGLSLSDRVWNYAQMGKSEIETAIANVIGDGITKGTSAEELGRAVRQYLNNPDMMYRRYHKLIVDNAGHKRRVVRWYRRHIDENGNVTFKDEPLEKVGTGTYRSARMNSLRLMRTEINMAYHNANNERWQREPFVIGIRIWLSPEHPEYDICDELMGEYPKNFQFSGWHPACLCASAPITIQGDEKKEFYRRLMDGEDMSNYVSPNAVKTPPAAWNKYINEQHDNILNAGERGKLAYHLRDNTEYWLGQFSADEQKRMGFEVKKSIRQIADERHLKRTPEKEQQLRDWWQQHKYQDAIMRDANKIISEIKDFPYINIQTLSEAISKNDYNAIEKAILKIKPQLEYEKTITPNILLDSVMRKKYGDDAVNQLYQNTSRTISKYKSLSIDSLIDKMKFEADWVVNHRSFATVKEVEAYYLREAERLADKKAFDEIISKISSAKPFMSKYGIDSMLTGYEYYGDAAKLSSWFNGIEKFSDKIKRLDNIKDFIKDTKTQSSILRKLVDSIDYAIQNNGINADITKLLDEAEQKVQSLQKIHRKKTNTTTLVDLKANLGNKMPKTLENLQSLIDKEMKYTRYNNSEITEFKKRMIDLFNNSDFGMNVPRIDRKGNDVLESIFNSWFKAQQKTGTGKGCVDISLRNRASKELFGTDINNTAKNEYEKYGFLMDKDILKQAKSDIASQYWSFGDGIQIRFKKDKVITTFTMEDSLNSGLNPSLTTDPFPTSASSINRIVTGKPLTSAIEATRNWARSYIELQYHGDLTLDCIESIFIPDDVVGKLSKTLIDKMRKYAIIYSESNDNLITL